MPHEKHREDPTITSLLHHKSRLPSVLTMGVIILIVYFNNGLGTRRPRAPRRTSRAGAAGKKDVGEAFFVFMGEFRKEFKHKNPKNKSVAAVGKAAGGRWKSLSESIIVYQLARALLFCHGRGVRHHDLEPHNLQIGGWVGILWFDPRKRKCSLLFINQRHFLLPWMDGTPSI
ncbi:uncharacterized protein LOC125536430 isoform X2 [Triticum urartu]|uniref:uncharacterized protein LOC125536430 isoform X2 n=1 Tax=Triticum urartu TaxID=4572 RepID=UPI002042FF4F|nr:uncharacterized protein LOC125536430 isoform X2 [Triticum urartu]